ncbi:type VII secretion-associated protein [Rhodococcus sp. NPDC127528]|uniref:type VII secretion-associated protein n=1 Tax=unclassified Rhodococcus (in: high G+C Gram-positive bacteria) TaxID=192944 RepID=UPI00362F25E4
MAAAAVSGARVLALHLTETTAWAQCGDHQWQCGVAVHSVDGRLAFGRWPAAVPSTNVEAAPIRFVDDRFLVLGAGVFAMGEVLAGVLAHVAGGSPTPGPVDLLVLTCPAHWGERRRSTLAAAGRAVAADVRLLSVPEALYRGLTVRPTGDGVVLDVGSLESVAARPGAADCILFDEYGAADLIERFSAASDLADRLRHKWSGVPSWTLITGELPAGAARALVEALGHGGGGSRSVSVVPGSVAAAGAHEWGRELGESPAPTGDVAARAVGSRRRYRLSVPAAALAVVVAAGVLTWMGSSGDSVSGAVPTSGSVRIEPQRASAGRATVTVPSGWHVRDAGRLDRADLVPDDGTPARILLVRNELVPGADLDAVESTLRGRVAENPDRVRSLERVDVDARQGLAYVESPEPDSQVRWRVFVGDQLQVSIGCQTVPHRWLDLQGRCDEVMRSLVIAGR